MFSLSIRQITEFSAWKGKLYEKRTNKRDIIPPVMLMNPMIISAAQIYP
jgi:hypothetical protein